MKWWGIFRALARCRPTTGLILCSLAPSPARWRHLYPCRAWPAAAWLHWPPPLPRILLSSLHPPLSSLNWCRPAPTEMLLIANNRPTVAPLVRGWWWWECGNCAHGLHIPGAGAAAGLYSHPHSEHICLLILSIPASCLSLSPLNAVLLLTDTH